MPSARRVALLAAVLAAALSCSSPTSGDRSDGPGGSGDAGVDGSQADATLDVVTPPPDGSTGADPGSGGEPEDVPHDVRDIQATDASADTPADGFVPGPPPCCDFQWNPCPEGLMCAMEAGSNNGSCLPPPADPDGCWGPTECKATETCHGAAICPCDAECAAGQSLPGTCQEFGGPVKTCCATSEGCNGARCVGLVGGQYGQCAAPPGPNQCYHVLDCPTPDLMICEGAVTCPCAESCVVKPGTCEDAGWTFHTCCGEAGCPTGYCTPDDGQGVRTCLEPPAAGACWTDTDCQAGSFCSGARYCRCGVPCEDPDTLGTCVAVPQGCCITTSDCGPGKACIGATGDLPGRCLDDPEGPACPNGLCCWSGDDCPDNPYNPGPFDWCFYCDGASFCPCVEARPDLHLECPDNTMGHCDQDGCI